MKVTASFPQHVVWRVDIKGLASGLELFKSTALKHLKKAFALFNSSQFEFKFETIDKSYVDRFAVLHQELMKARGDNFAVNLHEALLTNPSHNYGYQALSLYEADTYLGGLIYTVKPQSLNLKYRVLPHKLSLCLPAPLARMSDILLVNRALELGKEMYSLGVDRNPYGIHNAIGLAGYKLMTKARPYIHAKETFKTDFDWDEKFDVLLFCDAPTSLVNKAILLLADPANEDKYRFLQQDFLELDIIHRSA